MHSLLRAVLSVGFWASSIGSVVADEGLEARLRELARVELSTWVSDPELITELREQNEQHSTLSESDIDALDRQWRDEIDAVDRPLISAIMGSRWSIMLSELQRLTGGLVVEVFVANNRGLNIAQSAITSDYWQGDEPKFLESYGNGPDAVYVRGVEFDKSAQMDLAQVSIPIADPVTGVVVGVATFGLNVDRLP